MLEKDFERLEAAGEIQLSEFQDWQPPEPFETESPVPDFPVEVLPPVMAEFVECLSVSTQTPPEMAGILALGVLATAFQSKFTVEINSDWREPLNLFCVAVAEPGERKSAVLSALTRPVIEYEAEQKELERAEIEQNQADKEILKGQYENAKTRAVKGKGGDRDQLRAEVAALSKEWANFREISPFRLLVDDCTGEKLTDLMDKHGGCITVVSSEGGIFDAMAGRYDRGVNIDVYLKAHIGDTICVDRIGRPPNYIKNPRLTMILTIQPEVLGGLMRNSTFKGRGLCGRFLYAICKSKVGHREINPPPIPDGVKSTYRAFIRRILSSEESGVIRLSSDAYNILNVYRQEIERNLADKWIFMRDWGSKLPGAAVRIAALFHAAQVSDPIGIEIDLDTMTRAIGVVKVLSSHAEAAYRQMGSDGRMADAKYLWSKLQDIGKLEISRRDFQQKCRGKFKKAEDIQDPLTILENMGYIKGLEIGTGTSGRPSTKILVNPLALKKN